MKTGWSIASLESIQLWLMDDVRCPTTWPLLLRIRKENPRFGVGTMPTM